jgi:asparagine synthase (glutamine-hydrolysing)
MCGICGIIDFSHEPSKMEVLTALGTRMVGELSPRGPDGHGLFVQGNLVLGHRRLKIFDLSEKAQQPMVDSQLGLAIVYNGAIYNYREIRSILEELGYRFFSTGDTEVLLKAWHAWGEEALQKINGMFAFAVWHRDSGRVVLGRDRLGIKPLYYAETSGRLLFASSLPALLVDKNIDKGIDPVALHHYMAFHSVVPPPLTIVRGIRKLPPGTLMTIEADGTGTQKTYWELSFQPNPDAQYGIGDWKNLLHHKLEQAVKRRLVADVPVGVLLSGGLDSSLLVGLLAEAGQQGLNTFSVGFESAGGEKGDEFQYSDLIAEHFGTVHHKIKVDSSTLLPALKGCVTAMSEPMVSHDCIGFYLLSREVSKRVKVVQSGQGADEVFAGYHWYPPLLTSTDALADYRKVFFDGSHRDFRTAVHPRFHQTDHSTQFVKNHFSGPKAMPAIDKALRLDTTVMLIDDPVKRVDNMTMAWGLEARVPFLDHELVEFAARMPAELKVQQDGKFILKMLGREIIPAEVIDRPKGYFPVPALKYFRGEYFDFVKDMVTGEGAAKRDIFNRPYVEQVLAAPDEHITPLKGSRLWQMALLYYWLDVHGL